MWDNLTVKGFHFDSASEYADAKHEADTIDYISSKMDVDEPNIALKVYYKLLERQTMHTVVGLCFLNKLRENVIESGLIDENELTTIRAPKADYTLEPTLTGDETALENSVAASEYSNDISEDIPEKGEDEITPGEEVKELKNNLSLYKTKEKKASNMVIYYQSKVKKLGIIIAALVIIVLVLIGIAYYNNNITPVSDEIILQDKYAQWQESLDAKEKELKLREEEILAKEQMSK